MSDPNNPLASAMASTPYVGPPATEADKAEATVVYVCAVFTPLVPAILYFGPKKDASPFVKDHIRETLNFGLTALIVLVPISIVLSILAMVIHPLALVFSGISALVSLAFLVLHVYWTLLNGMPAMKRGEIWRYPFNLRLVK